MKKFIIIIALMALPAVAFASHKTTYNVTNNQFEDPNLFGVKADAPYLGRITDSWYAGVEGGKDLNYTNASQGWFAYAKITYTGTLLNNPKEK